MARKGDASIRAYVGGSGFGKSLSVLAYLRATRPAKLLVWDPQDECAGIAQAVDLERMIVASAGARFALRHVPPSGASRADLEERFALFCDIAYVSPGATVYVEELSGVTTASHAPPAWRRLCVRGRHQGLTVIGCAQRPAQVDKDFFGNCTVVRCFGGLRYSADADAMARLMRVSPDVLDALPPRAFVERDFLAGTLVQGVEPVPGERRKPTVRLTAPR